MARLCLLLLLLVMVGVVGVVARELTEWQHTYRKKSLADGTAWNTVDECKKACKQPSNEDYLNGGDYAGGDFEMACCIPSSWIHALGCERFPRNTMLEVHLCCPHEGILVMDGYNETQSVGLRQRECYLPLKPFETLPAHSDDIEALYETDDDEYDY